MPKKKLDKSGSLEIHAQLEHKIRTKPRKFKFTEKQIHFLDILLDPENTIIFVSGPAGTSKTLSYACDNLTQRAVGGKPALTLAYRQSS